MTVKELVQWLQDYEHNTVQQCKDIMTEEVPVGNTHQLKMSVRVIALGGHSYEIGAYKDYASYVNDGRGPVRPVTKRSLHWVDPKYGEVFTKYAAPSRPNDFKGRTLRRWIAYLNAYR